MVGDVHRVAQAACDAQGLDLPDGVVEMAEAPPPFEPPQALRSADLDNGDWTRGLVSQRDANLLRAGRLRQQRNLMPPSGAAQHDPPNLGLGPESGLAHIRAEEHSQAQRRPAIPCVTAPRLLTVRANRDDRAGPKLDARP
jgi:hypothetical protein